MKFDILETKHKIEEKRLIMGQKIENFLLEKLKHFRNFLLQILDHKNFYILSSILIITLSTFFSLNNSSFADLISYNFLRIFLLLISIIFLKKSEIKKNQTIFNLLITSIAAGFFFCISPEIFGSNQFFTRFETSIFLRTLKYDIAPILFFTFLIQPLSKNFRLLQVLILINIFCLPLIFLNKEYAQISYATILPTIAITAYFVLKNHYINFKKDLILFLILLLIPLFDHRIIFAIALDLTAFWWVFVILFNIQNPKIKKSHFIFTPQDFYQKIFFTSLALLTLDLTIFGGKLSNLFWLFYSVIFAAFIKFSQETHEEKYHNKYFSRLYLASILLLISHFISIYLQPFLSLESRQQKEIYFFKEDEINNEK